VHILCTYFFNSRIVEAFGFEVDLLGTLVSDLKLSVITMGLMIPAMHVDIDQIDPGISDFVILCLHYTTRLRKAEPLKFARAHDKRRCGSLMPFTA